MIAREFENDLLPQPLERNRWFRFSLKSLLILVTIVAVYLAGWASNRPAWNAPPAGTWQMTLPRGHQARATLSVFPDGRCVLSTGGVLSGAYRWKQGKLTVETPTDKRMTGLVWEWSGSDTLVLTAETPGTPTGSSYLGTRMKFSNSNVAWPQAAPAIPKPSIGKLKTKPAPIKVASQPIGSPLRTGNWQLTTPSGHRRQVTLAELSGTRYKLDTGPSGVFSGTYLWENEKLTVEAPNDVRMKGLIWQRTDEYTLQLIAEPAEHPTGSVYIGSKLRFEMAEAEP